MTEHLIGVPLKKGSDVDLAKPLKNLIASLYSTADAPADFTTSISEFHRLRNTAVSKQYEQSVPALEALCKYHDQISTLELKIPPHEVQIPFKWKDAFDKGGLFGGKVSLTVPSLGYDKVCVLFNIAAMQSQLGCATRVSDSDEELKASAKLFQSASGIFAHLKSAASVMGGQEPTPDLNAETLTILSTLMLAQAQEIFISKAIQDKMKDVIVAKLCMQCEDMYAEVLRNIQKDSNKVYWDREWLSPIAGKQAGYVGLANYFQSNVCGQKKQIGEQIARLNQSIDYIKQAQTRASIPNLFADYVAKATKSLADAKKDNDFIYHERIPDTATLVPIEKVASARLAKPTPVPMKFNINSKDLFEDLVPVAVHQAMAACDIRKAEMVGSRVGQLRESSQLLNSILASLNLPAALEDAQGSSDDVPQSLKEKSRAVQESGGTANLHRLINEIPELVQRNKEILDESERLLREEEESDQQLRAQLKEKWTRTPSDQLTTTFKQNAAKYRDIINNALAADDVVKNKLAAHREAIDILSAGEQGLANMLPKASSAGKETGSANARDNLKQLMYQVEAVKAEREHLETQLKGLSFDLRTPFLQALKEGAIDEPVMSIQILGSAFGQLDPQIKSSLERQESLIVAIQANSDEYFGRQSGQGADRRDQIMRQLAEGYDAFNELQGNVKEGTKFYNDLTQLLVAYQNKVSDYCFARKTEKEELLKDVTRDASSSAASGPPPRPPPPAAIPSTPFVSSPAPAPSNYAAPPYAAAPLQQQQQPGALPYPTSQQYAQMPMPYNPQSSPYPVAYTPMPGMYNPYANYAPVGVGGAPVPVPPPQNYPYPVQAMGAYPQQPYYQPQQPPR